MWRALCCWFGYHAPLVRDRNAAGRQVLRCSDCWSERPYLPVNIEAVQRYRERQREQAQLLRVRAQQGDP